MAAAKEPAETALAVHAKKEGSITAVEPSFLFLYVKPNEIPMQII